jgi:hypothetical protein
MRRQRPLNDTVFEEEREALLDRMLLTTCGISEVRLLQYIHLSLMSVLKKFKHGMLCAELEDKRSEERGEELENLKDRRFQQSVLTSSAAIFV